MSDPATVIGLSAAFTAGLAGSAHCFAMCGALAGAFGMRSNSHPPSRNTNAGNVAIPTRALANALPYQLGRLSGYTAAGAISGVLGATLQSVLNLASVGAALRIASGVLLLLIALRMLSPWNPLRWLETLGARFWRSLQPLTRKTTTLSGNTRAIALGFLWGWLPCGLVYSMLMFAALSGQAASGAAILLAFGLGTLPAMLLSSALASSTQQFLRSRWPRFASGALLLGFGIWMIWASLPAAGHVHHH